jgi:hypothetical protein
MNLASYTSGRDLLRERDALFNAICDDLHVAYSRAWLHEGMSAEPALRIPEIAVGAAPGAALPRRWAVAEDLGGKGLVYRTRRLPRHHDPSFHPAVARLARHVAFLAGIERAVVELANRVVPWFGEPPTGFDWVVTMVGPPVVNQLGYWLSTVRYSLDDALEEERLSPAFPPRTDLPAFWAETAADALKWELAVLLGLTIPGSYRPPAATRDKPFGAYPNPFSIVLDIWHAGAMLETSLAADIPTICVDARSLPPA